MKPTDDISAPDYFHKVVDLPMGLPHTPVPEYIRLIAGDVTATPHI
jgi:hypothetical protein